MKSRSEVGDISKQVVDTRISVQALRPELTMAGSLKASWLWPISYLPSRPVTFPATNQLPNQPFGKYQIILLCDNLARVVHIKQYHLRVSSATQPLTI